MLKPVQTRILFLIFAFAVSDANAQCGPIINTFPYSEGFEASAAWTTGGTNNDWAWGSPTHPTINSAGGGAKCWSTGGLSGSFYNYSELAWIMSPCFDFSMLNYPWISFKIFWEDEWKYDGMVLQYSLDGGTTWANVGAFGDAVDCLNDNWYDYNSIIWLTSANPKHGWTGRTGPTVGSCQGGNGSLGWVTAKHCLSTLANQPSVRFRFLFGAGTTCNSYDGIAVDDIFIDNAPPNVANFTYTCAGGNTVNFTNTSALCPTGYSWDFGDAGTSTAQSPSHTFPAPGTYNVTLTSSGPCNAPSSIMIPVHILGVTASATNILCNGDNTGIATAVVTGNGGTPVYSWSPGGQITSTIIGQAAGNYTVTVSSPGSCPASLMATATITEPPVLTTNITSSTNVTCNGANDGTANANGGGGTPAYAYSWNTVPVQNSAIATGLAAGNYTVTVQDANGCTATQTVIITQLNAVTAAITASTDELCNGGTNATATAAGGGGSSGYIYSWNTVPVQNTAIATGLEAGNYTVTVQDASGCTATQNITITQPVILSASTGTTVAACSSANGTASATPTGGTAPYSYSWNSIPVQNTQIATGLVAGNYTVTVQDANGCITTATATVTQSSTIGSSITSSNNLSCFGGNNGSATVTANGGSGGYTYSWIPAGGNGATANNLSAGNYTVVILDALGCITTSAVTITQPGPIVVSINTPSTICYGQSVTITANAGGGLAPYSYTWNNGITTASQSVSPLITTTYSVTAVDANGCSSASQSVIVNVYSQLTVAAASTSSFCSGQPGTISAAGSGGNGGPYSYSWNNSAILAATATVTLTGDSAFTVTVNDGCSLPEQSTVNITLTPSPIVNFTPQNAEGCPPLMVDFTDASITSPGSAYLWTLGDGSTDTASALSHTYTSTGQYSVSLAVTNAQGCSSSITGVDIINVYTTPDAAFISSEQEVTTLSPVVMFTDQSSNAAMWQWDFGDGNGFSDTQNPTYNYHDTGTYVIQLVVETSNGCFDTTYKSIRVIEGFAIYIPNAFTPDGDNINEGFNAFGIGIKEYDMMIYDRWGGSIYHSKSLNEPWTGTFNDNGTLCQNGVYTYRIKAYDYKGELYEYVGRVTLLR